MNSTQKTLLERPSRTKIVATLGPASNSVPMMERLLGAGVDVFRINAAHGTPDSFAVMVSNVRKASKNAGLPVAILMDLGGPKIRLGALPGDELTLTAGDCVRFVGPKFSAKSCVGLENENAPQLTCTYEPLVDELEPGDRVVLADGTVSLRVTEKAAKRGMWAACHVEQGGTVRSRQGVNLPGVKLSIPAMLEVDRTNAAWAAKNGVDFLGLSFVRNASEVLELKELIAENAGSCSVVAKIEKPEAVDNLLEIVQVSDAVMVARGDLGVETDIARIPLLQKEIIHLCHAFRKPVIVATQMLESMTHNNLPTRAEVTDVANAILDGADACMLSGESAVGDYPVETVAMMHRIALEAEESLTSVEYELPLEDSTLDPVLEAMAENACDLAAQLSAKFIVAATGSGQTALALSAHRCPTRILGLTHSDTTLHRLCLYWGVVPISASKSKKNPHTLLKSVMEQLQEEGLLKTGERVVLLTGSNSTLTNNTIVVYEAP